jgi:hypothetical protein
LSGCLKAVTRRARIPKIERCNAALQLPVNNCIAPLVCDPSNYINFKYILVTSNKGPFPVCVQVSSPIYMGKCADCCCCLACCWICTKVYSYVLDYYGFDSWWVPWISLFRVTSLYTTSGMIAIAISGGWGASGAGFVQLLVGTIIYPFCVYITNGDTNLAWRISLSFSSNTGTVLCWLFL